MWMPGMNCNIKYKKHFFQKNLIVEKKVQKYVNYDTYDMYSITVEPLLSNPPLTGIKSSSVS